LLSHIYVIQCKQNLTSVFRLSHEADSHFILVDTYQLLTSEKPKANRLNTQLGTQE